MPTDTKFTALMLFQGTLFFALMDALYAPWFMWRAYKQNFTAGDGYLSLSQD